MSENYDPDAGKKEKIQATENLFEVETDGILREFREEDIKTFVYDLFLVFSVLEHIDQDYGSGSQNFTGKDIKKFKNLIREWNQKYKDVLLDFRTDGLSCLLKVYFKEKDLHRLDLKIRKMNRYSRSSFSEDNYEAEFEESPDNLNTLTIECQRDYTVLIYNKEDMLQPKSPEFRLCCYFGLAEGYEKRVDLQRYANEFSFDISTEESIEEGHSWSSRYPDIRFTSWGGII